MLTYFSDFCDVGGLSINRGESQKSKQRVFNILPKSNILQRQQKQMINYNRLYWFYAK